MRICKATVNDAEVIYSLEVECFEDFWTTGMIYSQFDNKCSNIYIAYKGDIPVGYVIFNLVLDEIEILRIAVLKEYRKSKVASFLFDEVLKVAKKNKVIFINLEVRKSNWIAIAFYLKNDFDIERMRRKYYPDNQEDALLMTRRV